MKALIAIPVMIAFAGIETPMISDTSNSKVRKWRDSIAEIAEINERVSQRAVLTGSADVDAALLQAVGWRESRWRTYTLGGDCWTNGMRQRSCPAKGVMQIMASNRHLFPQMAETKLDPVIVELLRKQKGEITVANLSDPEINIRLGYIYLHRLKTLCKGSPLTWLTSYRYGHCAKRPNGDREGRKRCEIATHLLNKAGKTPEGWSCSKRAD